MPKFIYQIRPNAGQKPTLHFCGNCSNRSLDLEWLKGEFDPDNIELNEKFKVCGECKTKFRNGICKDTVSTHPSNSNARKQTTDANKLKGLVSALYRTDYTDKTIEPSWLEQTSVLITFDDPFTKPLLAACVGLLNKIGIAKYSEFIKKELQQDDPLKWPVKE